MSTPQNNSEGYASSSLLSEEVVSADEVSLFAARWRTIYSATK